MVSDAGEDRAEIGFGIDVIQFAGLDEQLDGGGSFAAGVGACEEPFLSAERYPADGTFGSVVVDLNVAVTDIAIESSSAAEGITHGLGEI